MEFKDTISDKIELGHSTKIMNFSPTRMAAGRSLSLQQSAMKESKIQKQAFIQKKIELLVSLTMHKVKMRIDSLVSNSHNLINYHTISINKQGSDQVIKDNDSVGEISSADEKDLETIGRTDKYANIF